MRKSDLRANCHADWECVPGRRGNSVQESAKRANQTLEGISLAQKLERDPAPPKKRLEAYKDMERKQESSSSVVDAGSSRLEWKQNLVLLHTNICSLPGILQSLMQGKKSSPSG